MAKQKSSARPKPQIPDAPTPAPSLKETPAIHIPTDFIRVAEAFAQKWKIPAWLFLAMAGIETEFGKRARANFNVFNTGTSESLSRFPNVAVCMDQFGRKVAKEMGLAADKFDLSAFCKAWPADQKKIESFVATHKLR